MLFAQTDRTGVGSIPLVLMVSFFLGLTMALLTGYQLQKFGTERLVQTLISIAFTRELGPLLTGIVLAARIGAAYTAELQKNIASDVRTISLDRLEASLAVAGIKPPTVAVRNEPPQVIVSNSPAILVPIDGAPVLKPVPSDSCPVTKP